MATEPNLRLAEARHAARLTQEKLAELGNAEYERITGHIGGMDGEYISKLERGLHTWPHKPYRQALCAVLRAGSDEELGFYSRRGQRRASRPEPDTSVASAGGMRVPEEAVSVLLAHLATLTDECAADSGRQASVYHRINEFLRRWAHDMKRRELIRILGLAATNAAVPSVLTGLDADERERMVRAIAEPSRVDATVIANIESMYWHCRKQDDVLGPQAVLNTIMAQHQLAHTLLAECPTALRPQLLSVYSKLSMQIGWLFFDLNDLANAWHYCEQARVAAYDAEATEISAFLLGNMTRIACWSGRARLAVDHAVAAQEWANRTDDSLLRAFVADRSAVAYALDGQREKCLAELGKAEAEASRGQSDENSLGYFYNTGFLASAKVQCFLYLNEPKLATAYAQDVRTQHNDSYVRNMAIGKLFLGKALIQSREIDEGAKILGETAALASRNISARLTKELHTTRATLDPWKNTAAVKALDARLHTYGLKSTSPS
jgi:transcriptional regulator with XRE-family HTH domain